MAGPEAGDRGKLAGLRSRPDLNGRRVEVRGTAAGKDGAPRLAVRLLFGAGAGAVLKVKAANLELDKDRVLDPAMQTLVAAMQALAPGATPEEERRDWAGLPEALLVKIATKHVAQNLAGWAAWGKKNGVPEEKIQEEMAKHKRDGNCLFVFAMVCKPWRAVQLKVGGPLRTRVPSDVLLPGSVTLVKWALAEGCPRETYGDKRAKVAASFGHRELVQFLIREQGFAMDEGVMGWAARSGNLEMVRWLRGEGCEWSALACQYAAACGQLRVLQWLRANGCPWDADTCNAAAHSGHLATLRWARENGCEWSGVRTCGAAAIGGHLKILQWLRANGCPWDATTCMDAANNSHVEVLRWARANGCPWNIFSAFKAAEELGYSDDFDLRGF